MYYNTIWVDYGLQFPIECRGFFCHIRLMITYNTLYWMCNYGFGYFIDVQSTFVLLIKIAALQGRLRTKKGIGCNNLVHRKIEQCMGKYRQF